MQKKNMIKFAQLAILSAIIILMTFTPLGYFRMPGIEITFITIPVVIGAMTLGPLYAGVLGGVFGLTSFLQCVFALSPFGATLLGIDPILTLILCMVPRILIGVGAGYLFKAFKSKNILAFFTCALSGSLINTIGFVGGLILLFGSTEYISGMMAGSANVIAFFIAFVGINGVIEAIACTALGALIAKPIYNINKKLLK